ncbi:hypothetical protein SAMN04488103_11627 [Gemmobacter aquatilis]|uniref:Uncharacterized protein n=1 Tax=Gemmobacter aquatilis TaxID=933059 RepID=A0A1H8N3E1_9RHOB|nr:hypothetical protein [Gemmobacter aquatilis]SEO24127.1 hypothetical protein SAMN04488103_11627 [Gemmobacter aquatilis]
MPHNLSLAPDAEVNATLALLREGELSGDIVSNQQLLPGLFFSLDPESETTGRFRSEPGRLLDMEFNAATPGRWMALHLALGPADLSGRQVLGVVCRCSSPQTTTFRFCLRSGRDGGFTDSFLRKTVVATTGSGTHLDALVLDGDPVVPAVAPWRELILFFRPETSQILLQDLRVFIV